MSHSNVHPCTNVHAYADVNSDVYRVPDAYRIPNADIDGDFSPNFNCDSDVHLRADVHPHRVNRN